MEAGMTRSILAAGAVLALLCGSVRAAEISAPPVAEAAPVDDVPEAVRNDLSATVPAGMPVLIDNPYGNVYLRFGGYEHAVDIHSTLQQPAGAAQITLHRGEENDRYLIAPRLPTGAVLAEAQRMDLAVYVAQGHAVTVRTAGGDIESRGLKSDIDLKSIAGKIAVRGTEGTVQAETTDGSIEVSLVTPARPGSTQRFASTTGNIALGTADQLDARVRMATSGLFATEYSIEVTHRDGEEPNKTARATIGAPGSDKTVTEVLLESRRGDIRLLRRAVYTQAEGAPSDPSDPGEDTMKRQQVP